MTLARQYVSMLNEGWKDVFADHRTHRRAVEHALAWPAAMGGRTISQGICMLGRSQQDWSAEYKMYSRSPWNAEQLFDPVIDEYLKRYPKGPVVLGSYSIPRRPFASSSETAAFCFARLSRSFISRLFCLVNSISRLKSSISASMNSLPSGARRITPCCRAFLSRAFTVFACLETLIVFTTCIPCHESTIGCLFCNRPLQS